MHQIMFAKKFVGTIPFHAVYFVLLKCKITYILTQFCYSKVAFRILNIFHPSHHHQSMNSLIGRLKQGCQRSTKMW